MAKKNKISSDSASNQYYIFSTADSSLSFKLYNDPSRKDRIVQKEITIWGRNKDAYRCAKIGLDYSRMSAKKIEETIIELEPMHKQQFENAIRFYQEAGTLSDLIAVENMAGLDTQELRCDLALKGMQSNQALSIPEMIDNAVKVGAKQQNINPKDITLDAVITDEQIKDIAETKSEESRLMIQRDEAGIKSHV